MNDLKHVAIIVDGNGRWAKEKGKARSYGHLKGSSNIEKLILDISSKTDIKVLSLYVFSTENFKRSREEVDYLMNLFVKMFQKVKKLYLDKNIKIIFSGSRNGLNDEVLSSMDEITNVTKNNTGLVVNFCLNYGGRLEIVDATKKICKQVEVGLIDIDEINEDVFANNLYNEFSDVDLLIRTSGEQRISNFLLWQISYSEFYFVDTYFPDFTFDEFKKVLDDYQNRNRRFGGVKK